MRETIVSTKTNLGYHINAADECRLALETLGFPVHIKGQRGAHGAELWVPEEYKEKFEEEIIGTTIIGTYRKFFIGHTQSEYFYYVSYSKIK